MSPQEMIARQIKRATARRCFLAAAMGKRIQYLHPDGDGWLEAHAVHMPDSGTVTQRVHPDDMKDGDAFWQELGRWFSDTYGARGVHAAHMTSQAEGKL